VKTIKSKWVHLSNGYWLKIKVIKLWPCAWGYDSKIHCIDIAVGKTRRIVNDHYSRRRRSPKSLYNKSSNNKGGLEALIKTMEFIQEYISIVPKGTTIRIEGSNEQRVKVYSRLLRYGFKTAFYYAPNCHWHKKQYYFKEI
jgi:hypothetical protein